MSNNQHNDHCFLCERGKKILCVVLVLFCLEMIFIILLCLCKFLNSLTFYLSVLSILKKFAIKNRGKTKFQCILGNAQRSRRLKERDAEDTRCLHSFHHMDSSKVFAKALSCPGIFSWPARAKNKLRRIEAVKQPCPVSSSQMF